MNDQALAPQIAVATAEAKSEMVITKGKKKVEGTGNLFLDVAVEVEHLNKAKALKLADELSVNVEINYFRLGGVLSVIQENAWFEGFETFDDFVAEKYGFQSRKAKYLIQIYKDLVGNSIPWDKVAHLGWTKIKDLAPILTLDNLDEWVAKAEQLSVKELQAALKVKDGQEPPDTEDDIKVLKFKCHGDQVTTISSAINKAKAEGHTEYDAVALELICTGYLGGSVQAATQKDAATMMKELGLDAVIELFTTVFPDNNITVEV